MILDEGMINSKDEGEVWRKEWCQGELQKGGYV